MYTYTFVFLLENIMKFGNVLYMVTLIVGSYSLAEEDKYKSHNDAVSNQTVVVYNVGVHMGIINPEKYSLESFERDENIFKQLYAEYVLSNNSQPVSYQNWLIINNFGLLADTQESLFEKKKSISRSSRSRFSKTVKKGDILITSQGGSGPLIGHAAIMVSDYWVLEMKGGKCWKKGIKNNNRQYSKDKWFEKHGNDYVTVYRCPDKTVATEAAIWADRNYYSSEGTDEKTEYVTFQITPDFTTTDPSYSSKLVLQAFYYGPETVDVVEDPLKFGAIIVPTNIPAYFIEPYTLKIIGRF